MGSKGRKYETKEGKKGRKKEYGQNNKRMYKKKNSISEVKESKGRGESMKRAKRSFSLPSPSASQEDQERFM